MFPIVKDCWCRTFAASSLNVDLAGPARAQCWVGALLGTERVMGTSMMATDATFGGSTQRSRCPVARHDGLTEPSGPARSRGVR